MTGYGGAAVAGNGRLGMRPGRHALNTMKNSDFSRGLRRIFPGYDVYT